MTIFYTPPTDGQAAGAVWDGDQLAAAYEPASVVDCRESGKPMRAIVRVAVALDVDQLLAALLCRYSDSQGLPFEDMSVEEIRAEVELFLVSASSNELDLQSWKVWEGFSTRPAEEREVILRAADAINRAYPTPAGPVVLDGTPLDAAVRCTAPDCGWRASGAPSELLLNDGIEHAHNAHGGGQ